MRKTVTSIVIFLSLMTAIPHKGIAQKNKTIQVDFNKNVEFLGLIYFLGYEGPTIENDNGTFEMNGRRISGKDWHAYGWHLYQLYKKHASSEQLPVIDQLATHIWLDYLISLLLQLDDFPNAKIKDSIPLDYYIKFSKTKDEKEALKNVATFIEAVNKLYVEVNFDEYLEKYQSFYENALNQVKMNLPTENFLPEMEKFYQKSFETYTLVPSLTIPTGMGFGIWQHSGDKTKIFNVFGPLWFQKIEPLDSLDMGFNHKKKLRELSTHEFGHSFANPVVESMPEELIKGTKVLFDTIRTAMENQGYNEWQACLNEHFVRAGEVLIAQNMGNQQDAMDLKSHYIQERKFIYLPLILEELEKYNINKSISYKESVKKVMLMLKELAEKRF